MRSREARSVQGAQPASFEATGEPARAACHFLVILPLDDLRLWSD